MIKRSLYKKSLSLLEAKDSKFKVKAFKKKTLPKISPSSTNPIENTQNSKKDNSNY